MKGNSSKSNYKKCAVFNSFPRNSESIRKSPWNPHRPMGIHHSPHTHPIPIPMGIPIPTAALTVCLFSAALCWLCWTRSRYVIRSASCPQMSMQAPCPLLYSSASAPRFRDTFGTASARLQQHPQGFRAFPYLFSVATRFCPQCLGTFCALSGRFREVSGHCPRRRGFRDNARKVMKISGRCGCRDDVRTTTRTRCRRCAEVHFHVQILLSTKILTRKLFDVRNVRKYPEGFRNNKNSMRRVSGICGQIADFQFLLSARCLRSSGRPV